MADNGGRDISDEEWARFVEQAAQGAGAAPQEPSARARMVTERLRREERERAAAARRGPLGFGRRSRQGARNEPEGWRTGPAWQDMRDGRGGTVKRRLKAAAAIVGIAALALVALRPELVIDKVTGKAAARARAAEPLPAETARPTAAPEPVDPDRPTLKEPFRGSPALQWADGEAGIEVPEAEAVGGVGKERVAEALQNAKRFLVVANLDPATLRGERPGAALELLDPKLEEGRTRLEDALKAPGKGNDPLVAFTRIDAGSVKLVGDVVKVRGRMWVEPGKEAGQADIKVDYSFVYPLVKAKPGAEEVVRSVVRREMTFSVADPRKWNATDGTLWLAEYRHEVANSSCEILDGFLRPEFFDDKRSGPTPSGTPVDPYDRSKSLAADDALGEGCRAVSRT
jgi:hypothetical protein